MNPTILSPWFVVIRYDNVYAENSNGQQIAWIPQWYTAQNGDEPPWSKDRKHAMIFNSLHSAHRVAQGCGGYVVAVCDEEDHAEYR
jgi:hypothetical protein